MSKHPSGYTDLQDQSNYNEGYSQAIADWNLGNRPPIKFQMRHLHGDIWTEGYLTAWHRFDNLED